VKISNTTIRRIDIASKIAKNSRNTRVSKKQRHFIACVIYKGSKMIGLGVNNQIKTHSVASKHYDYPYIHAEFDAIKSTGFKKTKKATAYVARYSLSDYNMCKPCKSCQAFLRKFGVKKVFFTSNNGIDSICL